MWDLETLRRLNDEEVERRRRRSEIKSGMITQSFGTPGPVTLRGLLHAIRKRKEVSLHKEGKGGGSSGAPKEGET